VAGNAFTYRFSGAYLIDATKTKLRASYGTAFKAPDLFDTFSTAAFALGNRGLRPETSQGYDVGFDQYLWDGGVTLSASFFQNYIHDVIAFIPTGPVTGSYQNRRSLSEWRICLISIITRLSAIPPSGPRCSEELKSTSNRTKPCNLHSTKR
jgi:outer membrane receptor protein involved in Fe transport